MTKEKALAKRRKYITESRAYGYCPTCEGDRNFEYIGRHTWRCFECDKKVKERPVEMKDKKLTDKPFYCEDAAKKALAKMDCWRCHILKHFKKELGELEERNHETKN